MKSSIWGLQHFREGLSVREGHIPNRRPHGLGYVNTEDEKTPWNTWLPLHNFLLHRLPDADDEQAGLVFSNNKHFWDGKSLKMRWWRLIWTCCFVIILSFTIRPSRFFFASCFPSCQSVQFLVGALVLSLKHFLLQLVVTVISNWWFGSRCFGYSERVPEKCSYLCKGSPIWIPKHHRAPKAPTKTITLQRTNISFYHASTFELMIFLFSVRWDLWPFPGQ